MSAAKPKNPPQAPSPRAQSCTQGKACAGNEESAETRKGRRRAQVEQRKAAYKARRAMGKAQRQADVQGVWGGGAPAGVAGSNRTCRYESVAQEREARQQACIEQIERVRRLWPGMRRRFAQMPDPRNPKKTKHCLTVLMLYGVLFCVLRMASRREGNREMTRPQFLENLRLWFPEIDELPHQDTLARVLEKSHPEGIEGALLGLVDQLIRQKKFARYLVQNCYPIAVDGTQKLTRDALISPEWLTRTVRTADGTEEQHYVYVLEANLVFFNGMTIPVLSEFLTYAGGEESKQDCEQRAFGRVVERLRRAFPRLPILLLLDGLYPNGPMMELCRTNRCQFMMVLPEESLPSLWEDFRGLRQLLKENVLEMTWKGRRQRFTWVNGIGYRYGKNDKQCQTAHVVVCDESWAECDEAGNEITKTARHAWISSEPLNRKNLHERCNLGARYRWGIEESLQTEKHHGYQYEHCFSQNWNAMRAYHYLMRIGHLINVLVWYSSALSRGLRELGIRGLLDFVRASLAAPWMDPQVVQASLARPRQLRLV